MYDFVQTFLPLLFIPLQLNINPHRWSDDEQRENNEKKQRVGRTAKLKQPTSQSQRQTIYHSQNAQNSVEHTYPCKVFAGAEMAHTLIARRVIHINGRGLNLYSMP